MPLADVNGVQLSYEVHGRGTPLVLVHEFAGGAGGWAPQVGALSRERRLVVYNCRGYPPSSVPARVEAYSQDISIEDLRQLLGHLRIGRTALGGFSMGGGIVLSFAIRHPERVSALVLAGTGSGSADKARFARDFGAVADRLERDGVETIAEAYLSGPTRIQLARKDRRAWQALCAGFAGLSSRGLANTIRGVISRRPTVYELEDRLTAIRVPTLVIVGEEDEPALGPSRFLAATIPGARLEVFPRTGHTVNLEEPEAFNQAVLGFLRSIGSGRS